MSNNQMEVTLEPVSHNPGSHGLSVPYLQMGQDIGGLPTNMGSHQLGSTKRKELEPLEPLSNNPGAYQLSVPNKRVANMEHRPWLQQVPATNRRAVQMDSVHNVPGSPHLPMPNKKMAKLGFGQSVHNTPGSPHFPGTNKKMVNMESFTGRSGSQRSSSYKNQIPRIQPAPKLQKESFESVRSKMKESLAAALALVDQQRDKFGDSGKESENEAGGTIQENFSSSETSSIGKSNDGEGVGEKILADATTSASTLTSMCDGKEFQSSNILGYEDVSFSDNLFVKDELLQGNGLSWVLDSEMEMAERKGFQPSENQKLNHEEMDGSLEEEEEVQSPEELAFCIEAELFKLFGGVNKKYKEKGRSLLFNLKDRNNPELRERVMSGEIPPERLCSMTAEELASKELSEWRMAKAEELAQMVVLPDSEVDMRRLVKKTHKGEVEVEQFDGASMEVPVDATSNTQSLSRSKETELSAPSKFNKPKEEINAPGEKSTKADKTTECTFTIPSTEANDFMQGLMVDDGMKDLPPIVSLDEFMESLDTEPPFEILPEKLTPISDKGGSETVSESKSSTLCPKNTVDASSQKLDGIDTTNSKSDADMKTSGSRAVIKTSDSHAVNKTSDSADTKSRDVGVDVKSNGSPEKPVPILLGTPKGEHVWGGSLQLNLSPMASVIGIYKSGEKTSAKEWPGSLDIKGRVRLDAFGKFLQELPQSRSRAVMVVHFVPKEGSSETECASLREAADSYVMDERVGFSEPCFGVEIYFCPPHNKTLDMLSNIIQKEHIEALNAIDNGLVGVVVWRKLTSPKSSHHKKKQHFSSTTTRRQRDANLKSNYTSKPARSRAVPTTNARTPARDDDDDVPPGFGPGASRDEDDLPEFNFSGGAKPPVSQFSAQRPSRGPSVAPSLYPKSHTPSRPVDQMRELIQKYGQNNSSTFQASGVAVQRWNDDDDDDDIPEWQPNAPIQPQTHYQRLPPQAGNGYQQPMLRPHLANQPQIGLPYQQQPPPLQSLQPPMNVAPNLQNPNISWWAPQAAQGGGMYASNLSCQPEAQNAPKSRGF